MVKIYAEDHRYPIAREGLLAKLRYFLREGYSVQLTHLAIINQYFIDIKKDDKIVAHLLIKISATGVKTTISSPIYGYEINVPSEFIRPNFY